MQALIVSAHAFILFSACSPRVRWTTARRSPETWLRPVPSWFRTPCWRGDVPALSLPQRKLFLLCSCVALQCISCTLLPAPTLVTLTKGIISGLSTWNILDIYTPTPVTLTKGIISSLPTRNSLYSIPSDLNKMNN